MKNVVYFILLCVVATGIGFGSLNSDSYTPFIIIMLLKAWFIYGVVKRAERKRKIREREELFNEYMRDQLSRNRRY